MAARWNSIRFSGWLVAMLLAVFGADWLRAEDRPIPRVEIERPEFFVYRDGEVTATITGIEGSTRPDGRIHLTKALVTVYRPQPKQEGKPASGRQVLLHAGAGILVWTRDTSSIEVSSDFWVNYMPPVAASAADGEHGEFLFRFSGNSATINWDTTGGAGEFTLSKGTNAKIEGIGLEVTAAEIGVVADTVVLPKDATERRETLGAMGFSDVESITITAPKGLEAKLPPSMTLGGGPDTTEELRDAVEKSPRTRVVLVSDAELKIGAMDPSGERGATLKGAGGARVLPPDSETPILSGNLLHATAIIRQTGRGDNEAEDSDTATIEVIPTQLRLSGLASARVLDASGGAEEVTVDFAGKDRYSISLRGNPTVVGNPAVVPANDSGEPVRATVDLSASDLIRLTVAPEVWTLAGWGAVRAKLGFRTGHSIGVSGEELEILLDPPTSHESGDRRPLQGLEQLTPNDLRSLVSEGGGVLPRVAFFERPEGDRPGMRRLAVFSSAVSVTRAANGFDVRASGTEVRMSLDLPLSASMMVRTLLHPTGPGEGLAATGAEAYGRSAIQSTYEITTAERMDVRLSGLGAGELAGEGPGQVEIRSSYDTRIDEYPLGSDAKGHVSAGPVFIRVRVAAEQSGAAQPGTVGDRHRLDLASFDYSPSSLTGRVVIAAGSDIIDAARLELNYSGHTVYADLRGPVAVAARGAGASRAMISYSMLLALGQQDESRVNCSTMRTAGDLRWDISLGNDRKPESVVARVTKSAAIEYTHSNAISAASGLRAVEEWTRTAGEPHTGYLTIACNGISGVWRIHRAPGTESWIEGIIETAAPTVATMHQTGAVLNTRMMRYHSTESGSQITLFGPTETLVTGTAASLLADALGLAKAPGTAAPSRPLPTDSANPIPPLPVPDDGKRRTADISQRYPGGVRVTCTSGNIIFGVSNLHQPGDKRATAPRRLTTVTSDGRVVIAGLSKSGSPMDSMAGDVLRAVIRAAGEQVETNANELDRVSEFTLTGNVEVRGEDSLLTGDKLSFDPAARVFRFEGQKVGVGLQDRAKVEGVESITIVPAGANGTGDSPPSGADQVGPKLRAVGRKIVITLASDQEAPKPPEPKAKPEESK